MNDIYKRCHLCQSSSLIEVMHLPNAPIKLDFYDQPTPFSSVDCHDIHAHQCQECGFVQQNEPLPPEVLYRERGHYVAGYRFTPHLHTQMELLKKHTQRRSCLEIGCAHGEALTALKQAGFQRIVGLDGQSEMVSFCREKGLLCEEGLWCPELARRLVKKYGCFEVIMLRHVFEHLPNFFDFFNAVDILLEDGGFLFIEVPDFASDNAPLAFAFPSIWHEHCSCFTQESLAHCLQNFGYEIVILERERRAGGVLQTLVRKASLPMESVDFPIAPNCVGLQNKVNGWSLELHRTIDEHRHNGGRIFYYGASGPGVIMIYMLALYNKFDVILDDVPEKQNKYIPGCTAGISSVESIVTHTEPALVFMALHPEWEEKAVERLNKFRAGPMTVVPLLSKSPVLRFD